MRRFVLVLLVLLALALPVRAVGKTAHSGSSSKRVYVKGYVRKDGTYVAPHYRIVSGAARTTSAVPAIGTHKNAYCKTCPRDAHGRILRSAAARQTFMRQTGYPHGRPGYVVDHIVPLECGGADAPSNMQWQTVAEAKAKDRTERSCVR